MPYPLVLSDSIAGRCHRLVLVRRPRDVDRLFALTGSSGDVENGYVDRVEPPIEARLTAVGADQSASEGRTP